MKMQFLGPLQKYAQALEKENEILKNDPETALGQVIPQLRDAIGQNKRLSVLAAALIKAAGGKVLINKDEMESFKDFSLSIKWELPEGVTTVEDAKEFVFSFDATPLKPENVMESLSNEGSALDPIPENIAEAPVVTDPQGHLVLES
jgi:hypothetical protein